MTLLTNAFTSYSGIGNLDDLSDIIYNVDPTDTPGLTSFERTKATATLHEWQTDALAAAAANQQLEGDEPSAASATATVRLSNTCQISYKVPAVTGTQLAVLHAGRRDELAYQVTKRIWELRRDMETDIFANTAEVTGNATLARKLGGIPTWITTNDDYGVGGSEGGTGDTAVTDGTQRALTEDLLKTVHKLCWDNGGNPDSLFVGSFNKQVASTWTGNATRMINATGEKLVANIDVYSGDYGDFNIIPNRFQPSRTAFLLQTDMWAVAYLRPMKVQELSKTGDAERRQVIVEYTIESRNQKASGMIADLTTA